MKISSGARYQWASGRKDSTLKAPTAGKYRVKGKTIRWLSGVYKRGRYVSTIYPGYFSIDRAADNVWTGISCYRVPKPSGVQVVGG